MTLRITSRSRRSSSATTRTPDASVSHPSSGLRAASITFSLGNDMSFERLQPRLPERAVVLEPIRRWAQCPRLKVAVVFTAHHYPADQSGAFKCLDVLRDRVEGDRKWSSDLCYLCGPPGKRSENGAPRRIGHRCEHLIEQARIIFDHMVEVYPGPRRPVKLVSKNP